MEEVFKRENDKMVKLVQHKEEMLSNVEVYNHWAKLCSMEANYNSQLRKIQAQLDQVRQQKENMREIAKDCERRIPKQAPQSVVEPKEVNLNE